MAAILDVHDAGRDRSPTARAVLLAGLHDTPGEGADPLDLPVGARDARLIALRQDWFGTGVDCLSECDSCGETIEVGFDLRAVRAPAAETGARVEVEAEGRSWRARVPTSRDLLAAEARRSVAGARATLLERCLLAPAAEPGEDAAAAVATALAACDAQADVLLDVACPLCGTRAALPFDIAAHLWSELDRWADALLDDVHDLASAYGWSERDILHLPPARRLAYLERVGRTPGTPL
ncbi:hypothetical protein [Sphingomonas sp.]|uniref:hypothetical protein n=1 Tax=Sphingomonas sp. TaxID=28214 RepID=UPI0035BC55DB